MKSIIGFILLAFIFSIPAAQAQTINNLITGTWKVTAAGEKTHNNDSTDIKELYPENDIWKFTADSIYYLPNYETDEPVLAKRCTYTIKDSVIYCNNQPTYKIITLTGNTLAITSYNGSESDAGLYIFARPAMAIYLTKQ